MKRFLFLICTLFFATNLSAQRIAVLEFDAGAGVSRSDIDGISEIFNTYFRPEGYSVIDRTKVDNVIGEWDFQRSRPSEIKRVRIGKLLNVSNIVVGTINIVYGNQYQVDTRVLNVETGVIVATSGDRFKFEGDYRSVMKGIATRLADQIAIKPQTTQTTTSVQTANKRDKVDVVLGYLKVYPNELGIFPKKPADVIEQINNQHLYDYDTWRIPTDEELALLRANNYLGSGVYMSTSTSKVSGIVLLVTDAKETYTQRIEREAKEQAARIEAERMAAEERARLDAQKEADRIAAEKIAAEKAQAKAEEKARIAAQKEADRIAFLKSVEEENARYEAERKAALEARAKEKARIAAQKEAADKAAAEEKARLAAERTIKIENRRKAYAEQQKRFGSIIDFLIIDLPGDSPKMGFTYTAGYHFNNKIYLGGGAGLNFTLDTWRSKLSYSAIQKYKNEGCQWPGEYMYEELEQKDPLAPCLCSVPIFAYFKANFINRRCSPFFALAAGGYISGNQSLVLDNGYLEYNTSRAFINPQIGVNFRTTIRTSIYFAVGVNLYTVTYCKTLTPDPSTTQLGKRLTANFNAHIGFAF